MYVSVCVPACMPSCLCLVVFQYVYVDCHYMYLSTGAQCGVISTDPKIAPVKDQPSVYGELTDSGQTVQNYNC